jgi:hypothetical protein
VQDDYQGTSIPVSTRTFVLFNKIISAVKYCLSSFSIKPNIEFGMASHFTGTKKSTSHDRTFFCFFEETGTFRPPRKRLVKSPIAHYPKTIDDNKDPQTVLIKRRLHSISSDDEYLLSNYWQVDFMRGPTLLPCQLASTLNRC